MGISQAVLARAGAGAGRFGLVSTVVFATVGFAEAELVRGLGLAGAYLLWIALFLGGGSWMLAPLVPEISRKAFAKAFVSSFLAYAVCWCAAWFALPNRLGEWLGALAGSMAMAWCLNWFGVGRAGWPVAAVLLFTGNSVGYFWGDWAHDTWGRPWGMVAWGVLFGLGTGGALGAVASADRNGSSDSR